MLIKKGAEINLTNGDGKTPEMFALQCGCKVVVTFVTNLRKQNETNDCRGERRRKKRARRSSEDLSEENASKNSFSSSSNNTEEAEPAAAEVVASYGSIVEAHEKLMKVEKERDVALQNLQNERTKRKRKRSDYYLFNRN